MPVKPSTRSIYLGSTRQPRGWCQAIADSIGLFSGLLKRSTLCPHTKWMRRTPQLKTELNLENQLRSTEETIMTESNFTSSRSGLGPVIRNGTLAQLQVPTTFIFPVHVHRASRNIGEVSSDRTRRLHVSRRIGTFPPRLGAEPT